MIPSTDYRTVSAGFNSIMLVHVPPILLAQFVVFQIQSAILGRNVFLIAAFTSANLRKAFVSPKRIKLQINSEVIHKGHEGKNKEIVIATLLLLPATSFALRKCL